MLSRQNSFRVLSISLAIVLLIASILKLHLLLTDPFADLKTGYPVPVLWLAVFAELAVVGIFFLKGATELRWVALFSVFVAFLGVSTFNTVTGKSTCGCLGSLQVPPVWFLALDVLAIVLLLLNQPIWNPNWIARYCTQSLAAYSLGAIVVMLAFATFQHPIVRDRLAGKEVSVASVTVSPKDLETKSVVVTLRNSSAVNRQILGIAKSCTCIQSNEVDALLVPAKGEISIPFEIRSKTLQTSNQRVLFYLNSTNQYAVAANIDDGGRTDR